jgi:hypothetical protein
MPPPASNTIKPLLLSVERLRTPAPNSVVSHGTHLHELRLEKRSDVLPAVTRAGYEN